MIPRTKRGWVSGRETLTVRFVHDAVQDLVAALCYRFYHREGPHLLHDTLLDLTPVLDEKYLGWATKEQALDLISVFAHTRRSQLAPVPGSLERECCRTTFSKIPDSGRVKVVALPGPVFEIPGLPDDLLYAMFKC